ncbi:unnamed protein product, partial [Ectocarpus sp. 12 AP-2014]
RGFSRCGVCGTAMDLKKSSSGRPLLFCGVCDTGFPLPHKGKLTKQDPEFECPLCHFQVLSVSPGNDYTGAGYTVCPYCFNNAPAAHGGEGQSQFRCFMCSASCPLAKRVQGGDTTIVRCWKAGCGQALNIKRTRTGNYHLGCKGYPACTETTVWLPKNATNVSVTEETCARCSGPTAADAVRRLDFTFKFQRFVF